MSEDWVLIRENPDLHGPEYSGETEVIPLPRPPVMLRVTVWHARYLPVRTYLGLGPSTGGVIWMYDEVIRHTEKWQFYIPVPRMIYKNAFGDEVEESYVFVVSSIAFRDTPGSIGYRIEAKRVELTGDMMAIFPRSQGGTPTYPRNFFYTAKDIEKKITLQNHTEGRLALQLVYPMRGYQITKHPVLKPGETFTIELRPGQSVEVTVTAAEVPGFLTAIESAVNEPVTVQSGDEIRPEGASWVGSLGLRIGRYLTTNEHVCPEVGKDVYLTKGERKLGRVVKVGGVRVVSRAALYLNALFGMKLPANYADVAFIEPEPRITYTKFMPHGDLPVEPAVGARVHSRGRTSGVRSGTVRERSATIVVPWPHKPGRYAVFEDVIALDMLTQPGDSGSAVVTDEGPVGLIFAGTTDHKLGFAVKIKHILSLLPKNE